MAAKKSDRTAAQFGRDVLTRKMAVIDLALKYPQAAIKALDVLADNQKTDMARDVIAGVDVALKYHLPEARIQKMAARALRNAGLAASDASGDLPMGAFVIARDFDLRVG